MGFIQINSVGLTPSPTTDTLVQVWHRLTSDPDVPANYNVDSVTLNVPVGGTLASPFYIKSLLDSTSYTVKIFDDCGDFYRAYTTIKVTAEPDCPAVSTIIGTGVSTSNLFNVYVGARATTANPDGAEILTGIHSFQDVQSANTSRVTS